MTSGEKEYVVAPSLDEALRGWRDYNPDDDDPCIEPLADGPVMVVRNSKVVFEPIGYMYEET